jgi:hypothetical protein
MKYGCLAQWLGRSYISIVVGEVWGSYLRACPFWLMIITKMHGSTNHFQTWRIHHIWFKWSGSPSFKLGEARLTTRFGGTSARFGGTSTRFGGPTLFFFFHFRLQALIGNFPTTMWNPMIFSCGGHSLTHPTYLHSQMPHHLHPSHLATSPTMWMYRFHVSSTSCTTWKVVVWISMWHFSIGPHTDQKIPKMGDTWHPLVLAHHHANVMMKSSWLVWIYDCTTYPV